MTESATFVRIMELVREGSAKISDHALDALRDDALTSREVVAGVEMGVVVEDYPEYGKGPCVLVLQRSDDDRPVHALWGLHKGTDRPAALITAYIPDPDRWNAEFMRRLK